MPFSVYVDTNIYIKTCVYVDSKSNLSIDRPLGVRKPLTTLKNIINSFLVDIVTNKKRKSTSAMH